MAKSPKFQPDNPEAVLAALAEIADERASDEEVAINQDFAFLFSTEQGKRVLAYLDGVCLEYLPLNPQIPANFYLFFDGRRELLSHIKAKIKKGTADMVPTPTVAQ